MLGNQYLAALDSEQIVNFFILQVTEICLFLLLLVALGIYYLILNINDAIRFKEDA